MSLKHRREAAAELWARYRATFAYFWKHRDELKTGLFRADEAEFLPAALAVQETPASKTARLIAWLLSAMVVTIFLWSILGRMDIVVNAEGKVIPSACSKTIAAVDTGSVVELNVDEGRTVKAGDVLLRLDTRTLDAERDKAQGDRNEAVLTLARNQALLEAIDKKREPRLIPLDELNARHQSRISQDDWEATRLHVRGQYHDYAAKSRKLADDIAHYVQALPLAARQAESYRRMLQSNDVSRDAWQEREQARLQLRAQLQEARNQQHSLTAETRKAALDQIAEARRIAAASSQDAVRAASASQLLTLRAPVDGTVQQLTVHTLGGVVPAAQPIMQIVPRDGPVEVEAFMENKDKGFVRVGQSVAVKVDTFNYTKYGTLPGRVTHVSQDAIPDEKRGLLYAVKIALDKTSLDVEGQDTPVTPGMAINAEIKTGSRRIIEYVLSPLIRHTHEAMSER